MPSSHRGRANGAATTIEAVGKAIGPTLGAYGFAAGVRAEPGLAGAGAIFWLLAALYALQAPVAIKLPAAVEKALAEDGRPRSADGGDGTLELATFSILGHDDDDAAGVPGETPTPGPDPGAPRGLT